MTITVDSSRKTAEGNREPEPIEILRQKAQEISEMYHKLFGEIVANDAPLRGRANTAYNFYVGVQGKRYRYLLPNVECGRLFDYPVTLTNTVAGTTEKIGEQNFKDKIRLIFNAPATKDLFQQMENYAAK